MLVDIILLTVIMIVYILVFVFLGKRKHYQPLKNKAPTLLCFSVAGMALLSLTILLQRILGNMYRLSVLNNEDIFMKNICCLLSLMEHSIAFPLLYLPYFFRAFRLN